MFHLASLSGETGGIPGPLFAVLYPVVTIVLVVAAKWLARVVEKKNASAPTAESQTDALDAGEERVAPRATKRRRRRERIIDDDPFRDPLWRPTTSDPTLEEIAYLSDPRLPVDVALAELLLHGAITAGGEQSVTLGPLPEGATGLQRAVYTSLQTHRSRKALDQHPDVAREVNRIRESLMVGGYLRPPGATILNIAAPAGVLLVALIVGYQRYTAGESTGVLMWEITAVLLGLVATIFFSFTRPSRSLTKDGQEYLEGLQREYAGSHEIQAFAKNDMRAPYAFSPKRAPLSVALFGTGAIHELYPDAAETLHIPLPSLVGSPDGPSGPAS